MAKGPWEREGENGSPEKNDGAMGNIRVLRRRSGGGDGGPALKISIWAVLGLVSGVWLLSGFYEVDTDELGVILRFGESVGQTEPGLHYHLPYPIEVVYTPQVTTSNLIEIGVPSQMAPRIARSRGDDISARPEEAVMLTGDENIVNLSYNIKWNVKDAEKYLFNIRSPKMTVRDAAEAAMREIIGQTPIVSALTSEKQNIGEKAKVILQNLLDDYDSGINVLSVELLDVVAPAQVIDAFDDVQNAITDKKRFENEAEAYRNDIIPKARGEAQQIIYNAEAYKEQVVNLAAGDTARYLALYNEYRNAREVVAKRMYIESIEEVMKKTNKVLLDDKAGGVLPYLPLKSLEKGSK